MIREKFAFLTVTGEMELNCLAMHPPSFPVIKSVSLYPNLITEQLIAAPASQFNWNL